MRQVSPYSFVVVFFFLGGEREEGREGSVSAGRCDRFPCTSSLVLSLLVDAGCNVGITASCGTDVGGCRCS